MLCDDMHVYHLNGRLSAHLKGVEATAILYTMKVERIVVGPVEANCWIVMCGETGKGAVIDPGDDAARILDVVRGMGTEITTVLNTHGHFDHIGANRPVSEAFSAPIAIHALDLPLLRNAGGAALFGLSYPQSPEPETLIVDGDSISIGSLSLEVLFTPGHTPGHVSFYERAKGVLFTGDVLFRRGIGRTDLPGSSHSDLLTSIREKLCILPDDTEVYPGHGDATTIGEEKRENPWLNGYSG